MNYMKRNPLYTWINIAMVSQVERTAILCV